MKTLLILNYSMDDDDPTFPHQISVVRDLSAFWQQIIVITLKFNSNSKLPSNVKVINLGWQSRSTFYVISHLLYSVIKLVHTTDNLVIFSHMTETLSAIISPITKFFGIKHFLWYAHTSKPLRLKWCHWMVNKIITSTPNSCPISSSKVIAIGQAVRKSDFECFNRKLISQNKSFSLIHVGRIDPSKNIDLIIRIFLEYFSERDSQLHLVGLPTRIGQNYFLDLQSKYNLQIRNRKIVFHGNLNHKEIRSLLCECDVFLHAFQGSLDKSLVEAVFSKIFVVSSNKEFLTEFSSLNNSKSFASDTERLECEIQEFKSTNSDVLQDLIDKRYDFAEANHSRVQWLNKLNAILSSSNV